MRKKLLLSRSKLKSNLIEFMVSENQRTAIRRRATTMTTMRIMSTMSKNKNITRRNLTRILTLSSKAKNSQDLID
jgi:predicted HTH transcriptional regulator